jgi:ribosomal protein S18 acetylase RimI-like enzyme
MITVLNLENIDDIIRLKKFSVYEHPDSFRYFKNRVFEEAIKSHKLTILYTNEKDIDVGYAHIDYDSKTGRNYFGICILNEYQRCGIGKLLMEYILQNFKDIIYLTVDNTNTAAICLYEKYSFRLIEQNPFSQLRCYTPITK